MSFSYAAAYLSEESENLFKNLGCDKILHMTTCFDVSAKLSIDDNVVIKNKTAIISDIKEWNTPSGIYLMAELSNCDWSKDLNDYFLSLGAVEDLPHQPHLTLEKNRNLELMENLKQLIGKEVVFSHHVIKVKKPELKAHRI